MKIASHIVILLALSFLFSTLLAAQDGQDIDSLLKQADDALKDNTPKKEQVKKSKNQLPPKTTPPPPQQEKKELQPVDTKDAEQILKLDLEAIKKEQEEIDPRLITRLSFASGVLHPVYILEKDDDKFELKENSNVKGVEALIDLSWKSGIMSYPFSLRKSANIGIALLAGEGEFKRTGVINETETLKTYNAPLGFAGGVNLSYKKLSLALHYGLAGEILHQRGDQDSQTTSRFYFGDMANIMAAYLLTKDLDFSIGFKKFGVKFFGSTDGLSSQYFSIGLGLKFSG